MADPKWLEEDSVTRDSFQYEGYERDVARLLDMFDRAHANIGEWREASEVVFAEDPCGFATEDCISCRDLHCSRRDLGILLSRQDPPEVK